MMEAALLKTYRTWRLYTSPERLRMRKVCGSWIRRLPPGSTVIEVGGGTAFLKSTIELAVPGVNYFSGDISPTNVTAVVLDAQELPIRSNCADAIIALEVLEHIKSPQSMVAEMSRVMRRGALAIVTVPFMFGIHDYRDYQRLTPLGFETMIQQHGLELVETVQRGGTFVAASGLFRTLLQRRIIGEPADWRAQSKRHKARWLVSTMVMTPWSLITWTALGLDRLLDPNSNSASGFFFLLRKS